MKLNQLNPSIKALTVVVSILGLSIVFDPVTPTLFLFSVIVITFCFGHINRKKWLLLFCPFLIIAIGYVWTGIVFGHQVSGQHVLYQWGRIEVTEENLVRGVSLGLRVLCFSALSLMFILTTNPIDFMLSLLQQAKLPPKFAYGIIAGFRFLPLLKEEMSMIRNAHRIRGVVDKKGIKNWFFQIKQYAIPLLASAIRKAERTAIAMESKGFTGSKERTYYKKLTVTWKDWFFLLILIIILMICIFISINLGTFQFYHREL